MFSSENSFVSILSLLLSHQTDPPLITLEFGTNPVVEGNVVSEGADVYFECNIKANPWVYRVAWRHNVRKFALRFRANARDEMSRIKHSTNRRKSLIRRITIMSFRIIHRKESLSQISPWYYRTSRDNGWASTCAPRATPKATDSASRFS